MGNSKLSTAFFAFAVLSILFAGSYMMGTDAGSETKMSESQAIALVMNNSSASEYMSVYFTTPEWRVSHATLIESSNESSDVSNEEDTVWKVELMERSCACSTVKDLYVVEAYVSPRSGEIFDVKTMAVLESEYDKKTCSTTACH
ncbi:hypothetical protein V7O66_09205 [Methanolobus sp. ZRKC3]|uniref:hypothetical protein n=1 Tax=Methanolobus sp. ZRKC3 TaxID=3125786 RepID=UPI0032557747